MYVSPIGGGRWYTCTACGFKGDSIEFYQKAHDLSDIRDAVLELSARNILPMRKEELSVDIIAKYVEAYVKRRTDFDALFAESQQVLGELSPKQLDLIQKYHLWEGYRAGDWYKRLERFIGVGYVKLMTKYGLQMPYRGFSRFLVIPYYDVPGRISSLLLLNKTGKKHRIYASPEGTMNDAGLMMLNLLDTYNDTVIAVRDPIFAIHLQRRAFNISAEPLKVVVYDEQTSRAWQTVHARRLIYWEKEDDVNLYSQSVMHPRAHIATKPGFGDYDLKGYLRKMSVAEIVNRIEMSAKPWGEAVKNFLLNSEYWKVSETLKSLQLSAADIQRIYDACSPSEKARVLQLFGEASVGNYITIGNMKIVESDDGWWIMRGSDRELGCNAIIRLEALVHIVDTGENVYEGTVSFKQEQLKFRVPVATVEKSAANWLRELMMQHVGALKLSKSIQPHIIEIAKQFHDPQYVRRIGKIGWNQSMQAFVFPNFSIKEGQFDDSTHAMVLDSAADVPAAKVYIAEPREGDWDLMLEDTPEHAAIWAGMAAFMSNMLSPIVGATPSPVAFVGGYGSVANVIGGHLVEELGMVSRVPTRPCQPLYDMPEFNKRHDYPVWLDLSAKNRKSAHFIRATDAGNFMTHLSEAEAAAAAVGESWTFIHAPTIMPQRSRLPSMRGAVAYLGWLQAAKFVLPPATSLQQCILLSLSHWALGKLDAVNKAVFLSAAKTLRTIDSDSIERRLMSLIFFMATAQRLKMSHTPFYEQFKTGASPNLKAHLVIDDEKQKIFVNLAVLRNAIDRAKLPIPDYDAAVRAFASTVSTTGFEAGADGFVINQPYWDAEAARWRKTR